MMTPLRTISTILLAATAGFLLTATSARAAPVISGECISTCGGAIRGCVSDFVIAKRSCKEQCRTSATRAECLTGCKGSWAVGRESCKTDLTTCRDACVLPDPNEDGGGETGGGGTGGGDPVEPIDPNDFRQCIEVCAGDLRTCSETAMQSGLGCAATCGDEAKIAKDACRTAPIRALCYAQVSIAYAGCLGGCFWTSRAGGGQCLSDFHTCESTCVTGGDTGGGGGGGGGYGSASAAFLEPVTSLID